MTEEMNHDTPGEKGWGKCLESAVKDGYGCMITKNIAVIRQTSYPHGETNPDKKGWHIQLGDVRTGHCIDLRFTPSGRKIESGRNTTRGGDA